MGVSSRGYRTDPGRQVVKTSLIRFVGPPVKEEDVDEFIESGGQIPIFNVTYDESTELYLLKENHAALKALERMGHRYVDVIVEGDDTIGIQVKVA